MQVDDRVSLKTVNIRPTAPSYDSEVCRFGASDCVKLLGIHYHLENMKTGADVFISAGLSRNPDHQLVPPAEIAAYQADESIYLRGQWIAGVAIFTSEGVGNISIHGTQVIPAYGIIVPSRQIFVWCIINSNYATGLVAEIYFNEVKLSRAETDLMNITWGKYRR